MIVNIFWFRRDLRVEDNTALNLVLSKELNVLPIFIFDNNITDLLPKNDARISFIYSQLKKIDLFLKKNSSSLLILKGDPKNIFEKLILDYNVNSVCCNRDYEPYAKKRDNYISDLLKNNSIEFNQSKDSVIFEPHEVLKDNGDPYTVYTPFKNKWLQKFNSIKPISSSKISFNNLLKYHNNFLPIENFGFIQSKINIKDYDLNNLNKYADSRDFPSTDGTSYLGIHLRFGSVSVRDIIKDLSTDDSIFLSELVWREFFTQILFHFPKVVNNNFKSKYDGINWRNNKDEFLKWCNGETGYPIVDAGMQQLNKTGYMHNRVRMITAGFLCKHLLIDWRWGEKYFALKLLDYELASNNGNWQWAAGTGCDSAPYFRIFNPFTQQKKFDSDFKYVKKWIANFDQENYLPYIVDHKLARERALSGYKKGIEASFIS